MKTKIVAIGAALVMFGSGSASASELLASVESVKGGSIAIGLDLVSDGTVAGFSFSIEVPNIEAKAIRSGNCVAQLPKGFTAGCGFGGGKLNIIASADTKGTTLPAGVTSIGTVFINSPQAKASSVRIVDFETSNDNGVSTMGVAKVDGVAMGDVAAEPVAK